MLNYCGVFVLAAIFQVISCQGPHPPFPANLPEECQSPPPKVHPHECCDVPPFLEQSKLAACGIEKPKDGEPPLHKPGPLDLHPVVPVCEACSKSVCLMKNEDLLDENEKIKEAEMNKFLDNWVKINPEFEGPIEYAKGQCMREEGPPGPPHICEADRFFFCMTGNVLFKCPTWKETDGCKKLQDHMEKCHKYFVKPAQ